MALWNQEPISRFKLNTSIGSNRSIPDINRESTEMLLQHLNVEKERNEKLQLKIEELTGVVRSSNERIRQLEKQNQQLRELMKTYSSVVGSGNTDQPLNFTMPTSTIYIGLQPIESRHHDMPLMGTQIQTVSDYRPQPHKPTPIMDDSRTSDNMVQSATNTEQQNDDLSSQTPSLTEFTPEWSQYLKPKATLSSGRTSMVVPMDNTKFSTTTNQSSSGRLFENFVVVAATEKNKHGSGSFEPDIVYTFSDKIQKDRASQIEKYSYPLGINIANINGLSDARNILEDDFFEASFFTLPPQHINSSVTSAEKSHSNPLISAVNPSNILYAITFKVRGLARTPNNTIFYETPKTYIFLTYLPFVAFFHTCLHDIAKALKLDELEKLPKVSNSAYQRLIPTYIDDMSKVVATSLLVNIKFQWMSSYMPLPIPDKTYVDELIVKFALECLRTVEIGMLADIFLFVILEKPIHLYSSSQTLLSQVILFVLTAIKPFRYSFPVKYGLPLCEYPMLESPLARIIGLNLPEEKFKEMYGVQPGDSVYFNLDQQTVYRHPKRKEHHLFKQEVIRYISRQQTKPLNVFKQLRSFVRKTFVEYQLHDPKSALAALQKAFGQTEMAKGYRRAANSNEQLF